MTRGVASRLRVWKERDRKRWCRREADGAVDLGLAKESLDEINSETSEIVNCMLYAMLTILMYERLVAFAISYPAVRRVLCRL